MLRNRLSHISGHVLDWSAPPRMSRHSFWSCLCASDDRPSVLLFHPGHPIRLNTEFRQDLHWWLEFFVHWNGISFFVSPLLSPLPNLVVASGAAGGVGSRALLHSWSFLSQPASIAFLELVPLLSLLHGFVSGFNSCRTTQL